MKKITNNSSWGKLIVLGNVIVLVFFILTMVFLLNFDKTNVQVIRERSAYDKAYEAYVMAQHPLKQDSVEVAYYTAKLDSLKNKAVATTKEEKASLADQIPATENTLKEKQEQFAQHQQAAAEQELSYNPLKKKWDAMNAENDAKKSTVFTFAILTFVLFLAKTFIFAHWGAKNSKNLHSIAAWMNSGMPAWMSYVAWFVPVYNLIKPLSFIKEIWTETNYILEDKGIQTVDSDNHIDNSGLNLSIWWALLLISTWLMNFILFKTFLSEGPLFLKANHSAITLVAIIIMIVCMAMESALIFSYNKKNKMLCDNEDKFNL